jgi:hypothetical protein
MHLQEPLLRSTPLQVAAGNHEIECDNRTSDIFVPYESYFRNPNRLREPDMWPVPDDYRKTLWSGQCTASSVFLGHYDYGNSFYSFTHGLAHVVVLNSYTDTLPGSVQYQWLDEELAERVDRQTTPWLLVMFHCPLHTTFVGHNGEYYYYIILHTKCFDLFCEIFSLLYVYLPHTNTDYSSIIIFRSFFSYQAN